MRNEKYVSRLFDFQKFEGNDELSRVIGSVLDKSNGMMALSDDELEWVAAAGSDVPADTEELGAMIQSETHFLPVKCKSSVCRDQNITFYITGKGTNTVRCPYCKMRAIIAG